MDLKNMRVLFPAQVDNELITRVTVVGEYRGHWIMAIRKDTGTMECLEKEVEPGCSLDDEAKKYFDEITGCVKYAMTQVCPYAVKQEDNSRVYGMLYFVNVKDMGTLPKESPYKEFSLYDRVPMENWTYPDVQPLLLARIRDTY